MSWEEIREWPDPGLEIGAHTVNHIPLNQATFERARWEILESSALLRNVQVVRSDISPIRGATSGQTG